MDIDGILRSLDQSSNEHLLNFTSQKIKELNYRVLQQLGLEREEVAALMEKLREYKYIDEFDELKYGSYVRWILLDDPDNLALHNGALFCEIVATDSGNYCVLRSLGLRRNHFRIPVDRCLLFQKLTPQELIILSALDHLASTHP